MICRQTKEHRLFVVADRDIETINNLIVNNIETGSIIHTDGWRGYRRCNRIAGNVYVHRRYVHATGNARPQNRRGTNMVERLWGTLKACLKRIYTAHGRSSNIEGFVQEASWRIERQRSESDDVSEFLRMLSDYATRDD